MKEHRRPRSSRFRFLLSGALALLFLVPLACTTKPHSVLVLAERPMSNTFVTAYPSIETVYRTDDRLEIVVYWAQVQASEDHTLKWEIVDDQGRVLFTEQVSGIPIRTHMYYSKPVELGRGGIDPGTYTLRLHQDGELCLTRPLSFSAREVQNRTVAKAVILPFTDRSTRTNMRQDQAETVANTVSHGLYCHLKRCFRETVPPQAAKLEFGGDVPADCLDRPACRKKLERIFGKSLFITGSILLKENQDETARLEVRVFNAGTGGLQEYAAQTVQHESYNEILQRMMKNVMMEEGLLADLREAKL
ncbi:MAG: hypothetical protein K9M82_09160 [Deltaproteobacteria bacterium]|nr:hypothetical protein [Deltaproteobacteria bacterium]